MRLLTFATAKLLIAVVTLWVVAIVIFAAAHAIPGGFAQLALGPLSTAAQRATVNHEYGLDQSLLHQYYHWQLGVLHGNFGISFFSNNPVASELGSRLPVTIELTVLAAAVAVLLGIPLGLLAALSARSLIASRAARLLSSGGLSFPDFALGSLAVYVFSRYSILGLHVGGYVAFTDAPVANLQSVVLPAAVLAVFATAAVARTTRDSVLNVLTQTYITAAVSRGDSPATIVRRHVLRNAAIPIVTVASTIVAYLLGGAVIVEELFNVPGVGQYLVNAVTRRDYAVVEAAVLLGAAVFVVVNMLVDVLYAIIDPRIKLGSRSA